jgi:hypothetical protein
MRITYTDFFTLDLPHLISDTWIIIIIIIIIIAVSGGSNTVQHSTTPNSCTHFSQPYVDWH